MSGQPDAAPQAEPRSYALEGLRGLQSEVPRLTQAMILCRARVERHRNTDLAAARDDYNELQSARKRLADALAARDGAAAALAMYGHFEVVDASIRREQLF